MRKLLLLTVVSLCPVTAAAGDVYLAIGGSVNNFRTDARILNPSATETIEIQARLLAPGNVDNSAVQPRTITIPPREMAVYDDVVASLFQASGLGAIRLSSQAPFVATQRIYAQATAGTLGQFVPGIDVEDALTRGVLIQLRRSDAYRTNIGVVNPGGQPATITWRLHDRNNNLVAEGQPMTLMPYGVVAPTAMHSGFFFAVGSADMSDAWVSFTSDRPVVAYASVVDNATTDPTYITASEDTGEDLPQQPSTEDYDVFAAQFSFSFSPTLNIKVGDEVAFHITTTDVVHGFMLQGPDGRVLINPITMNPNAEAIVRTFRAEMAGTYTYACTHSLCGEGHSQMTGAFTVSD